MMVVVSMMALVAGCGSGASSGSSGGAATTSTSTATGTSSAKPIHLVFGTATTNVEPSFVLAYVAVVRKYFAQEGLDVSIKPFGLSLASAVARGDADFVFASAASAFPLENSGKKVKIVYNGAGGGLAGAVIAAKASIKTVKDCKSMVSAAKGTAGYAWAVRYKDLYGGSYDVIPATDSSSLTPSVLGGRADCAIGAYSLVNPAVTAKKAHYVVDPRNKSSLGPDFPSATMETALWGLQDRIKQLGPATMTKVLAGMQKALHDVRTDSDTSLAKSVHSYPGTQQGSVAQLAQSIALTKPFVAPEDGSVSSQNWDVTRAFYQAGGYAFMTSSSPLFTYDSLVDMSYLSNAKSAG